MQITGIYASPKRGEELKVHTRIFNITNQENVNQSHISYYLTLLRMTATKQANISNVSGYTERGSLRMLVGRKPYSQYGKLHGSSQRNRLELPYDPAVPVQGLHIYIYGWWWWSQYVEEISTVLHLLKHTTHNNQDIVSS